MLITTSGTELEFAVALADAGMSVVIVGHDRAALGETAELPAIAGALGSAA